MMESLKFILIKYLPKSIINGLSTLNLLLSGDYLALRRRLHDNEHSTSNLALYILQQQTASQPTQLNQHELRVFSQNGEDGILFYLFSKLGTTNLQFVEFGIGDGKQCNSANLSLNFGWRGLLMEADEKKAAAAQNYYKTKLSQTESRVQVVPAKITKENINSLLKENQIESEIDLLSIDIDGNDYWVWQAIELVQARVVVIEYNATLGDTKSVTTLYDPDFDRYAKHPSGYYHGTSLTALNKLAEKKGYILVGCDTSGTNAFFVRKDVAQNKLTAVSVQTAFFPSLTRSEKMSQAAQFALITNMPFEEV